MTCGDVSNLLPLFLDGELRPQEMCTVTIHVTRCSTCDGALRRLERLGELVSTSISTQLNELDPSKFWPAVERQLRTVPRSSWQRWSIWWNDVSEQSLRLPTFAAVAAIAILALLFLIRDSQPPPPFAVVENTISIDELDTDRNLVALITDPETRTTLLWVGEDSSVSAGEH